MELLSPRSRSLWRLTVTSVALHISVYLGCTGSTNVKSCRTRIQFKMKFFKKNNLLLIIVDISASTGVFVRTVCLIAVRRSVSGRTGCRRYGRVGKTPRICSSTCLASFLICIASLIHLSTLLPSTETRGLTNSPISTASCFSPRNWAANSELTDRSDEGSSRSWNVNNNQ